MAKTLENYDPLVQVPASMTPANGTFPIVESHDILVGASDKRLDAKLDEIDTAISGITDGDSGGLNDKVDKSSITTSVAAATSAVDTKIPTEKAVRSAIDSKTITVDSSVTSGSANAVSGGAVYTALNNKVDKVTGKQLSTEDYTSAEKTKLAGVATGATNTPIITTAPEAASAVDTNVLSTKATLTAIDSAIDAASDDFDAAAAALQTSYNTFTNEVDAKIGEPSDAANSAATAVWPRLKNAENEIGALSAQFLVANALTTTEMTDTSRFYIYKGKEIHVVAAEADMTDTTGDIIYSLTTAGSTYAVGLYSYDSTNSNYAALTAADVLNITIEGSATAGTIYYPSYWYYYDTNTWKMGSAMASVDVDPTLSVSGAAADAKVTGDQLTELSNDYENINNKLGENIIYPDTLYIDYYVHENGTIVSKGNYVDTLNYVELLCNDVDKIYYTYYFRSVDLRALCFYDENDIKIGEAIQNYTEEGIKEIPVPNGAYIVRASVATIDQLYKIQKSAFNQLLNINNIIEKNTKNLQQLLNETVIELNYDNGDFIASTYINQGGNEGTHINWMATDYIEIPDNVNCVMADFGIDKNACACFYGSDKNILKTIDDTQYSNVYPNEIILNIPIPNGAKYIRGGFARRNRTGFKTKIIFCKNYDIILNDVENNKEKVAKALILDQPIQKDISNIFNYHYSYYIRANGTIAKHSGGQYAYSDSVMFNKGDKINYHMIIKSPDVVSGISKWTESGIFIENIYVSDSNQFVDINYTVQDDTEYIRLCYYCAMNNPDDINDGFSVNVLPVVSIEKTFTINDFNKINENEKEIIKLNEKINSNKYLAYCCRNVLFIGDSLTAGSTYAEAWGEFNDSASGSIDDNIPRMFKRMLNCDSCDNASRPGMSASTWWDRYSQLDISNYDTFIIWLGTNDAPITSLDDDVNPYSNPEDFAESETGFYCRILEKIKAEKPSSFIVLVKIFASKSKEIALTNSIIDQMALKYNALVIDNSDLTTNNYPKLHADIGNPHFCKNGNAFIANRYIEEISKYFAEDPIRCEFGYTVQTNII